MASGQHEVDTNRELESLDGAATWLVASFTTLTAGLTAFGAVSGGLTRMLRNYPGLSLSAAILTSAAIGLGIAAKTFTRPVRMTLRTFLVLIGVLLFIIVLAVVVSGGLTWMLHNYPGLSVWGVILAGVAIGVGLGSTIRLIRITGGTVDSITARRWLLRIGVLLFVIGLTLAVTAATQAPHGRERPQITASLNYENGLTLVGEVKASDLRWTDFMEVSVLAAWISEDSPDSIYWKSRKLLYISHTGPDADGNVNLALRVPIRAEKRWNIIQVAGSIEREPAPFPSCTPDAPENFGCIALRLPAAHLPQVSATWSTIGDHPALTVTTKAHDEPSTNLIRTTVLARSRGKMHILSQARLSSDSKGDVSHTQVVLVSDRDTTVCVIAERLLDPLPKLKFPLASNRCPAGNQGRLVERLAVPK